jgi:hypothetical protein
MDNKDMLIQLEYALSHTTSDFRHTDLYKLLKDKLSSLGYWKSAPRGNPRKGYNNSTVVQQVTQLRQQLKDTKQSFESDQLI